MHQERANPGIRGNGHRTLDGILKQRCAQMEALRRVHLNGEN